MSFDFYVDLASQQQPPASAQNDAADFAGGFVDHCAVWAAAKDKNTARQRYMEEAKKLTFSLPPQIPFATCPSSLLHANWLALQVNFTLLTPWYSRDDRVFHVLDNPVRKDRVFGVPFMAAASWKGLLRWACRMQAGLGAHLEQGKRFEDWQDPDWIQHLFGNEKGEDEHFHQGALVFYPTWFNKIGFKVINPHSRTRRAGTQPIYYEVVPPKTTGMLCLLYAPWPGMQPAASPKDFLPHLLESIEKLLTTYGISAKRTVGWGTAQITEWKADRKDSNTVQANSRKDLCQSISSWF